MSKIPVAAALVVALMLGANLGQARPAPERRTAAHRGSEPAALERPGTTFEPNRGQARARVDFVARSEHYAAALQSHRVVVSAPAGGRASAPGASTTMVLAGASRDAGARGQGRLGSSSNYLLGSDSSKWATGVPHYRGVTYENVYPGVDVDYYGASKGLEFDFVVAPNANPGSIRLAYPRARSLRITARGALAVDQGGTTTIQTAPVAYQVVDGRRKQVGAAFSVSDRRVRFELGAYDRSRPLVIDPVLDYSTYLGGIKTDIVYDLTMDDDGNAYATGRTGSVNFPVVDPWQSQREGDADVFVSKFSPTGELLYSTFIGGEGYDVGFSLAIKSSESFYVTGITCSRDYPTKNAVQKNVNGRCDSLLTRFSQSGSKLNFSTYVGGSGTDRAEDVAYGKGGVYLIGETTSKNELRRALQNKYGGGLRDAFIAQLEADGDRYKNFTYLGGKGVDRGRSITVDDEGRAYVTGFTDSTNFPTTNNAFQPKKAGPKEADDFSAADAFIAKLNSTGRKLKWSTFLGGRRGEIAYTIELGAGGKPWVGGRSQSKNLPTTTDAYQPETGGGDEGDGMLLKMNAKGTKVLMCTYFGGSGHDRIYDFALDDEGIPAIAGRTDSPNFPLLDPFQPSFGGGTSDAYVARFTAGAKDLVYSTYLGGSDFDRAFAVAAGASGVVVAGGETRSVDFFISGNAMQPAYGGGLSDGFVTRVSPDP